MEPLLTEDYVTCLAEGDDGSIWIGHRKTGFESRDSISGETIRKSAAYEVKDYKRHPMDGYISALLPASNHMVVGRYVEGLTTAELEGDEESRRASAPMRSAKPPSATSGAVRFPLAAKPMTAEAIERLAVRAKAWGQIKQNTIAAAVMDEEWMTKGDWVGRYGRQYNVLCATMSPLDQQLVWDYGDFRVDAQLGPKFLDRRDWLRSWVHWIETLNPNTLYNPVAGIRRQAEWDDHGEAYPMALEGPDIWIRVELPQGIHRLSLYFFNKDGHSEDNRCRDYVVQIRRGDDGDVETSTVLAQSRVRDFWGGVYKRFVVSGPGVYLTKISRNYSHNTTVSALFVDKLRGPSRPYDSLPLAFLGGHHFSVTKSNGVQTLPGNGDSTSFSTTARLLQIHTYRRLCVSDYNSPALAQLRWQLGLWTTGDRELFANTMNSAWSVQVKWTPHMVWQRNRKPLLPSLP